MAWSHRPASRITWPPFQRNGASLLEKLRKTIKAAAPEATETIAYQMPVFKDHGRFLVSYAAFKDHYSLFPLQENASTTTGAAFHLDRKA